MYIDQNKFSVALHLLAEAFAMPEDERVVPKAVEATQAADPAPEPESNVVPMPETAASFYSPVPDAAPATAPATVPLADRDALKRAMIGLYQAKGEDATVQLLQRYGVNQLSLVPESQVASVMAEAEALTNG